MTNTVLLEEYIKKSGYKKDFIVENLGISRYSFNLKCYNKSEFKVSEIEKLCGILKISTSERSAIFFAK